MASNTITAPLGLARILVSHTESTVIISAQRLALIVSVTTGAKPNTISASLPSARKSAGSTASSALLCATVVADSF